MRMRKRKSLRQINSSSAADEQKSAESPGMQEAVKTPEKQNHQGDSATENAKGDSPGQGHQQMEDAQGNQQTLDIMEAENGQDTQEAQANPASQDTQHQRQNKPANENYEKKQNNGNTNDRNHQNHTSRNDNKDENNKASEKKGDNDSNSNGDLNGGSLSHPSGDNSGTGNDSNNTSSESNRNKNSNDNDSNSSDSNNSNGNNDSSGGDNNDNNNATPSGSGNNNSGNVNDKMQPVQQQQNQQQNQQGKQQSNQQTSQQSESDHEIETDLDSKLPPIDKSLEKNIKYIETTLGNSTDLIIRKFPLGLANDRLIAVLFIDGLCDGSVVNDFIMEPLMQPEGNMLAQLDNKKMDTSNVIQLIKDRALTFSDIHDLSDFNTLFHSLMSGDAILFIDGETSVIAASIRGWRDRGVTETSSENVVRGSREGFSESLRTNTALVRRRIKDPSLWLESRQIGHVSRTDVAIMYIKGLVSEQIVQEVHSRLDNINIDSILESGYIEELIQDETLTPFPTVYYTERPDVIAAELLEGKIAILVDGTPIVLAVPAPFVSFMHAAEDYYQRADISSFIRILRYVGLVISLLSPSFYIAVTTFHQEMIPTQLLMSLAAQREAVPFPAFIEALMMELTFEILREAGVRMPKYIGAAVSIVGTLVIGQAAVQAGFISAAMVIVVSLTAISSFVLPSYNMSIAFRMLRFPLMGLAASFGLVGIFVGCTTIILHLCSLRTFGVPYMTPFGPMIPSDNKDTLLRFPHRFMIKRPRLINQKNIQRETPGSGQNPPKPR